MRERELGGEERERPGLRARHGGREDCAVGGGCAEELSQ